MSSSFRHYVDEWERIKSDGDEDYKQDNINTQTEQSTVHSQDTNPTVKIIKGNPQLMIFNNRYIHRIGRDNRIDCSCGQIYKAIDMVNHYHVAIKAIKIREKDKELIKNEIWALENISHPNILSLSDYWAISSRYPVPYSLSEYSPAADDLVYIVTPWASCDLFDMVDSWKKSQTEDELKSIFIQILDAVIHSHKCGVAHLDIKPENILYYNKQDKFVLADWGFCIKYKTGQKVNIQRGSAMYISPEIYQREVYDPEKSDVWALGVVLFILINQYPPWHGGNIFLIKKQVCNEPYKHHYKISSELESLVGMMLDKSPASRCTLNDVFTHPWLTGTSLLDVKTIDNRSKELIIKTGSSQQAAEKEYDSEQLFTFAIPSIISTTNWNG